jgi:signal transduction histidine kinase
MAQVATAAGEVLAAAPVLAAEPPIAPAPAEEGDTFRTIELPRVDDGPFRVLSRRVDSTDGPVIVYVASSLDVVSESTSTLRRSLILAVPILAALLGGLIWWLVGRTLQPVEAIRVEVAGIGGSELHRRVPVPGGGDEIARLATTMNAMLDRVEDASRRQQRFVADASHELRSPLTRIRSEMEVDLAHPEGADLAATHRSVLEEAAGLQRLVDDLLLLARTDAGASPAARGRVDLDDVVLRSARRLRERGVAVDSSSVTGAQVIGDADQLGRAVANVVDNAARHATARVTLGLAEQDGHAVLAVTDDGPGVPPQHHERVFDRFTRLDDARSTDAGGAGLGLAIAREIVERHGGRIRIDPTHVDGARFVITLPLADSPPRR